MSLDDHIVDVVRDALAETLQPLIDALGQLGEPRPLVYTSSEAAVVLGISERMVRDWCRRKVLPRIPNTDVILIPRAAVEAFVAAASASVRAVS